MRPATPDEIGRWDQLVAANPDGGNVLQCQAFGETKARHGWGAKYFMLDERVAVLVLARRLPLLGELLYVPKGPGVADMEGLKKFTSAVTKSPAFMVKIDPEIPKNSALEAGLSKLGYQRVRDIQYNSATVLVDLRPGEDEILASFKQKTRYNIRLAQRKGVTVQAVDTNDQTIDELFRMAKTTYERAGVYVRSKDYFADFWRLHAQSGAGQMFIARYEGRPIAGAFVTYLGKKALYKDGASYREHSEVQAPYLLQWEIMCWLKERGVTEYDLHGTPPADRLEDASYPLHSLARFKTGFNGQITEYIGTYDLPLRPGAYKNWQRFGQRMAMAYEFRVRRRLFY